MYVQRNEIKKAGMDFVVRRVLVKHNVPVQTVRDYINT